MAPKTGLEIGADLSAFRKEMQDAVKELRGLNENAIKAATGVKTLEDRTASASKETGFLASAWKGLHFALGVLGVQSITAVTLKLVDLAKQSVQLAINLEGVHSRAKALFGDALPQITAQIGALAKETKRSTSDLLDMATQFGSLMDSAGASQKQIEKYSVELAKLAVNIGKAHPEMSDVQIYDTLEAAINGNARGLRNLGITMKDDQLQRYATSQGIKVLVKDMDTESLMRLRTKYLIEQGTKAQVDATDSASSAGEAYKEMGTAIKDAMEKVGIALAKNAPTILSLINQIAGAASAAIDLIGKADAWARSESAKAIPGLKVRAAGGDARARQILLDEFGVATKGDNYFEGTLTSYGKTAPKPKEEPDTYTGKPPSGGGSAEDKRAKMEKEYADTLSQEAKAQEEILKNRREELLLRQRMGVLTRDESAELQRINNRLVFKNDRVQETTKAWEDEAKALDNINTKIDDINDKIKENRKQLLQTFADIDAQLKKDLTQNNVDYVKNTAKIIVDAQKELDDLLHKPDEANNQARINELRKVIAQGTDLTAGAKAAPYMGLENQQKDLLEGQLKGLEAGKQKLEAQTAHNDADSQRIKEMLADNAKQTEDAKKQLEDVKAQIAAKTPVASDSSTQISQAVDKEKKYQSGTDLDRAAADKAAADEKSKKDAEDKKLAAAQEHDLKMQALEEEQQAAISTKNNIVASEAEKKKAVIESLKARAEQTKVTYAKIEADTDAHIASMRTKFAELNAITAGGQKTGPAVKKAAGGPIFGPGGPTSDSIPAWLSNGEYVINSMATRMYRPLIEKINAMALPVPRFASGGAVTNMDDHSNMNVVQHFNNAAMSNPLLHRWHLLRLRR